MKNNFLRVAVTATLVFIASFAAKAQIKLGDNLGNHKAAKDLDLNDFQIYNSSGISIGTGASTLTNGSIGLQFGDSKALVVSNVATNTDITNPESGMIIYNLTDNKFYLYQDGAWVTFALSMKESPDGITLTSNPNGYTLTQEGEETVLRLSPASEEHPGIVTSAGDQTFGGNKTFGGNVIVGSASSTGSGADNLEVLGNTKLDKDLEVTGETDLTGDARLAGNLTVGGTTATIENNLVVHGATSLTSDLFIAPGTAAGDDTEVTLVVDKVTGEVRKTTISPNSFISQSVIIPTIGAGLFENNSTYDVTLTGVTDLKAGDAVFVNLAGLPGIVVFSAVATADETVLLTLGDLRQPPAIGTLDDAGTLISGQSVLVARHHQN